MEFLELAKKRYSCRNFLNKEVEKEKIDNILEAARLAPTAVNFQPQRILVLKDKNTIEKLKEATPYTFDAPLIFAVCYDKEVSWKRKYDGNDEGIVDVLGIPQNYEIVSLLPTGYPAEDAKPSSNHEKRESLDTTVFYEKF